jgi:hypothetical protein
VVEGSAGQLREPANRGEAAGRRLGARDGRVVSERQDAVGMVWSRVYPLRTAEVAVGLSSRGIGLGLRLCGGNVQERRFDGRELQSGHLGFFSLSGVLDAFAPVLGDFRSGQRRSGQIV